jgi:hypothetical protein
MATRFVRALRLAALGFAIMGPGAVARGEPRSEPTHANGREGRETLPELPELRLTFPSFAKSFTFGALAPSRFDSAMPLWEAKAHWLEWDKLSLLIMGGVREALELDCRLLCEPFVERSLGTELRLFPTGIADDNRNYLAGSADLVFQPGRQFTRWEISMGGPL